MTCLRRVADEPKGGYRQTIGIVEQAPKRSHSYLTLRDLNPSVAKGALTREKDYGREIAIYPPGRHDRSTANKQQNPCTFNGRSLMSFEKALNLLELAEMARASHEGITLQHIRDRFGVSHRTAQRMTDALEAAFPHAILVTIDPERRSRWRIRGATLARLALQGDRELAAIDLAIAQLGGSGDEDTATNLQSLRDRLLAALPERTALRTEADAEALIATHGLLARPGPIAKFDPKTSEVISEALRGPFRLSFNYRGKRRAVEPYGILVGTRRYLVARDPERADANLRRFRIDLIEEPLVLPESFPLPPNFSLARHAMLGFGSYHDPGEYQETIWHFSAEAAPHAREWRFHPEQTTVELPDGRLEVRFSASGWIEMAWHLLQWGSHVEVVAPEGLRRQLEQVRRGSVEVFP